jgi:hypothetical protein
MLTSAGISINFAHRTFEWTSEARGKAHVHVVIVGFALENEPDKSITFYERHRTEASAVSVSRINPYLVDAQDIFIERRTKPLSMAAPTVSYGSMPIDEGCLIFTKDQRDRLITQYPAATRFLNSYTGGKNI